MKPTQVILSASLRTHAVTDKSGRQLLVRHPTALDTLRLFKAAGPTLAQNEPWLAMASLACSVQAIDGIPVPSPTNEMQIEALIERLGDDGLTSIANSDEAKPQVADTAAQVGNLPGTPS